MADRREVVIRIVEQKQTINDQKQELAEIDQKYEAALNRIAELQEQLSNR